MDDFLAVIIHNSHRIRADSATNKAATTPSLCTDIHSPINGVTSVYATGYSIIICGKHLILQIYTYHFILNILKDRVIIKESTLI